MFGSREIDTAVSAAILYLAVSVCDVISKPSMCSTSAYYVIGLFWFVCLFVCCSSLAKSDRTWLHLEEQIRSKKVLLLHKY